ncbi:MAG TPA: hypothetical protein VLU47_00515, partial [Blastocatellia bacterium]|nr:hypothetical protein [Blastocatellia bacterium]
MAQLCRKCGAALFAGQRFCRACGAITAELDQEHTPTQRMPPQPGDWGARGAATGPTPSQDTSPVHAPPQYYQSQGSPSVIPPYQPRSRSPVGWIIALVG